MGIRTERPGTLAALVPILTALVWSCASAFAAGPTEGQARTAPNLEGATWVRVSYGQLLDGSALVRTGHPLVSAVRDSEQRGAVQPFIDPYTYVLQYAVQMLKGPDELPYADVTENYEPGGPQPAWVAIFRGGRVHATADGRDRVRLFLPGTDPDAAYGQHYPVVRHCLNALLPGNGRPLQVEVYAYEHDYAASELRLNARPSQVSGTSFPSRTHELDLAGLAAFFASGATPEGAQLSRSEGLVLYGRRGGRPTLDGHPVALSDLAVAYRAAFHAGDNAAFVSLDEHADPTKVTVNYGGFLEDTRIGSVVLKADKRFKTITSGIDPDTQEDLSGRTRQHIPAFLSVAERDLASGDPRAMTTWAATRLWFYPNEAGVETDPEFRFAAIVQPQFTADAERSRKRFVQPDGSGAGGDDLSPGLREGIAHFNAHYAEYAQVFPELRELSTVARLMAVVSWLLRADPDWLDLDSLLAVELPAHSTERERTNLLVATVGSAASEARLLCFTPVLDRALRDYFKTSEQLARFLAAREGVSGGGGAAYGREAEDLLKTHGGDRVRTLVRTRSDLRALVDYALVAEGADASSSLARLSREIEGSEKTLRELEAKIEEVKSQASRASGSDYNRLVDRHNALVRQHGEETARHRERVTRYNGAQAQTRAIMEIAGGIDLDPRSFQILTPAQSARLDELRALAQQASNGGAVTPRAQDWLRSQAARVPLPPEIAALPGTDWQVKLGETAQGAALTYAQGAVGDQAWGLMQNRDGSWQATLQQSASRYLESSFMPDKGKLDVRKLVSGRVVEHLIGGVPAAGLIVFEHPKVREVLKPISKPLKWIQDLF